MALLPNPSDLALPKGSLILVTGSTGYVASNLIHEAIEAGYSVRGTTRSVAKTETENAFDPDRYERVCVARFDAPGAFDEAVAGVDAIVHLATPTDWSSDPAQVVTPAVNAVLSLLRSARQEPRVKRFVYSSSSVAATPARPNQKFRIHRGLWNAEVEAYATQPGTPYQVYSASKMRSERAVWDFVKKEKPSFVVNSVVPNFNIGRIVGQGTGSSQILINIFHGKKKFMPGFPPQHMINVVDDARLHLLAALDGTVANERIFAFAYPYNWNDILDVFRELRPDRKFLENDPNLGRDITEVDNELGLALLKKWYGQTKYTDLRESVKQHLQGVN